MYKHALFYGNHLIIVGASVFIPLIEKKNHLTTYRPLLRLLYPDIDFPTGIFFRELCVSFLLSMVIKQFTGSAPCLYHRISELFLMKSIQGKKKINGFERIALHPRRPRGSQSRRDENRDWRKAFNQSRFTSFLN